MSRLALLVATVAYIGFIPIAPGTFGTAAGLAILWALRAVTTAPAADGAAMLVTFALGTWAASEAERYFNRKDARPIVIDEVLGVLITMALLPLTVPVMLLGFLLFRLFDVVKPFPAGRLEGAPGGYGVMLDDAMAGVYAHLALRLVLMTLPPGWFA
ncbi:MAG: phosphatidylglycerophosphatase A [Vicinamibacterales bacterium]